MGNFGSRSGARRPPPPPPALQAHLDGARPPYHHRYPGLPLGTAPPVPVERHRAVAVHAGVNVKGDSLRLEPDDDGSGLLLAFSFDADAPGSITVYYFAQEDEELALKSAKENLLKPVTVTFNKGHAQEFKQPCGTGIDVSQFEESELTKVGKDGVFPLAFKVDVAPSSNQELEGAHEDEASKCLVKFAIFVKKDNAEYGVCIVQQTLWVKGTRYVLQEIYGIGNTADENNQDDESGKECVICLSKPRDTTVLPCRHMCLCQDCAQLLRLQSNKCPICRQPVGDLLEIEVDTDSGSNQKELIQVDTKSGSNQKELIKVDAESGSHQKEPIEVDTESGSHQKELIDTEVDTESSSHQKELIDTEVDTESGTHKKKLSS